MLVHSVLAISICSLFFIFYLFLLFFFLIYYLTSRYFWKNVFRLLSNLNSFYFTSYRNFFCFAMFLSTISSRSILQRVSLITTTAITLSSSHLYFRLSIQFYLFLFFLFLFLFLFLFQIFLFLYRNDNHCLSICL